MNDQPAWAGAPTVETRDRFHGYAMRLDLADFYRKNRGERASFDDIRASAEAVTETDFAPFFAHTNRNQSDRPKNLMPSRLFLWPVGMH